MAEGGWREVYGIVDAISIGCLIESRRIIQLNIKWRLDIDGGPLW